MRKAGADRGDADFEEISWDKAFGIMEERLAEIRATDPKNSPWLLAVTRCRP